MMSFPLTGHCGKLGSYTLMHLNSSSVIDIQLIQVTLALCQQEVRADHVTVCGYPLRAPGSAAARTWRQRLCGEALTSSRSTA